jgi:hypothetical protein
MIMYPTPLFSSYVVNYKEEHPMGEGKSDPIIETVDSNIFWLFFTGVYLSKDDLLNLSKFLPMQVLYLLLIFEKLAQRW